MEIWLSQIEEKRCVKISRLSYLNFIIIYIVLLDASSVNLFYFLLLYTIYMYFFISYYFLSLLILCYGCFFPVISLQKMIFFLMLSYLFIIRFIIVKTAIDYLDRNS